MKKVGKKTCAMCKVIRSISLHPVIGLELCACFKNGIHSTGFEGGNTTVPEEWFELGYLATGFVLLYKCSCAVLAQMSFCH